MTKPVSILIAILALAGALALAQGVFINASGPGSAAGVTVAQDIRTNLTLSGTGLNPNVAGVYTQVTLGVGDWRNSELGYELVGDSPGPWHIGEIGMAGGSPWWAKQEGATPEGDYTPFEEWLATGTVHVVISSITTNEAYSYPSVLGVTSE